MRHQSRTIAHMWGIICLLWAATAGCTHSQQTTPATDMDYLEVGNQLQRQGDYLNASYWYEAALEQHPEKEEVILRQMVEAQIRAGRLLAAQSGLERLHQLLGQDPTIQQLSMTLQQHATQQHATFVAQTEVSP